MNTERFIFSTWDFESTNSEMNLFYSGVVIFGLETFNIEFNIVEFWIDGEVGTAFMVDATPRNEILLQQWVMAANLDHDYLFVDAENNVSVKTLRGETRPERSGRLVPSEVVPTTYEYMKTNNKYFSVEVVQE